MNATSTKVIFTEDALMLLRRKLDIAETLDDFYAEVDEVARTPRMLLDLPSSIELESPLDGEREKKDISLQSESARIVYESLGIKDKANAADPRLWSYLTLVTCREYVRKRWELGKLDKKGDYRPRVVERALMLPGSSRAARRLMRNALSRLWWTAHMTSDPELSRPLSSELQDPYAYTKWVLSKEDRRQNFLENEIGWSPEIMWVMIETLVAEDVELNAKDASREMARNFNLQTGYRRVDLLDSEELAALAGQLKPDN